MVYRSSSFPYIWHSKEEKLAQVNLPSGQMLFYRDDDTNANFTKNGVLQSVVGFQAKNIKQFCKQLKKHNVQDEEGGYKFLDFYDIDGNMCSVECDV
ncbi:VOC family protein [Bacillus sp. FJAT-49711]|uniref:VOC family protein n=1 Tax=Bacillus sp. FJAT-49711 TaxID=2833585 RepID=UPI001BCA3B9C|nr:VOC family protein [Bacillus sp. FJAT-49711]MBS4218539.1 VOC family protein [Bacillus sp. FJAT-49711]